MTARRYCSERPLPAQAYLPGQGPHPASPSAPASEWRGDDASLATQPAYLWGIDLYNHGFYWEAHESWEELWRVAKPRELSRDFLQGLIQCAAAILKRSIGQNAGFESLADKGLAKLERVTREGTPVFAGIDLRAFQRGLCSYREADPSRGRVPPIVLEAHDETLP